MCLWECFLKRLAFEAMDRVKQSAIYNVSDHHRSCRGPELNKKAETSSIYSLPALICPQHSASLVLKPSDTDRYLNHQPSDSQTFKHHHLSQVSSLWVEDHGISQPLLSCEQMQYNESLSSYKGINIDTDILYCFCFSEEPWLILQWNIIGMVWDQTMQSSEIHDYFNWMLRKIGSHLKQERNIQETFFEGDVSRRTIN